VDILIYLRNNFRIDLKISKKLFVHFTHFINLRRIGICNMMDIHNVSFFSTEVRESVYESFWPARADREGNRKLRDANGIYSQDFSRVGELLRRLDILRDLMARLSFTPGSFYRIPDYSRCGRCAFGNYIHLYTSYRYIRPKNYALRSRINVKIYMKLLFMASFAPIPLPLSDTSRQIIFQSTIPFAMASYMI